MSPSARRRPPVALVVGAVVVVALVVVGNFATGYRGRDDPDVPVVTTQAPRPLADMVETADEILIGRVVSARRIGELRDPAVVAVVVVDEVVRGDLADGARVPVYDRGFLDPWREGDRVLLFAQLAFDEAVEAGARLRVQHRFPVEGGRLQAPFSETDLRAAAAA